MGKKREEEEKVQQPSGIKMIGKNGFLGRCIW
jgi:hypothetical protein